MTTKLERPPKRCGEFLRNAPEMTLTYAGLSAPTTEPITVPCALPWCGRDVPVKSKPTLNVSVWCSERCVEYDVKRQNAVHKYGDFVARLTAKLPRGSTAHVRGFADEASWAGAQYDAEVAALERAFRALSVDRKAWEPEEKE